LRTQFCKNVWPEAKIAVTLHRQNQTKGCDKDNKHIIKVGAERGKKELIKKESL